MGKNTTILGLDLGTNSIGWALVKEDKDNRDNNEIIKLGVRVNPLSVDEKTNFEKGKPLTTNADRTLKRGARRNLQRYKLRRKALINELVQAGIIHRDTPLTEIGKNTTHESLSIRAKAASEKIELAGLAKVLLMINKKRGYKSSRKVHNEEEGQAIDGMNIAKHLYEEKLTPGQYVLQLLKEDRKYIPEFYRSDLKQEFDLVWSEQNKHYPHILSDKLYKELQDKNKSATWAILAKPFNLKGIKLKGNPQEKKLQQYQLRADGVRKKLEPEHLAIALQDINNNLQKSSGYLGAISDRSKELYFHQETVGQNLFRQIQNNPHTSLKNQVFYRQDYLDEFEKIWEQQAQYHSELTPKLKEKIRDIIIFYQRPLKSQKGLISFCQFESNEQTYIDPVTQKSKKRTIGRRVVPKSSPIFQQAKIWQVLNNLSFKHVEDGNEIIIAECDAEIRQEIFEELNLRGDLKPNQLLKILGRHYDLGKTSLWNCNFEKIEGNRTQAALFNIYQYIAEAEGYGHDWARKSASEILHELHDIFPLLGIDKDILNFDPLAKNFDQQKSYLLWHLIYSAQDDVKISDEDSMTYGHSSVAVKKNLHLKFGFPINYAKMVSNVVFQNDYGNLSAKAWRKILPFLIEGNTYDVACALAGYNHSNSLTKEELESKPLADSLEIIKKNSLRNPVVEKILNQMVHVVNQIIKEYGKPGAVRIELARELKKSAKQRSKMTTDISAATRRNDDIKNLLQKEFGIPNATKNDVIRYRLWQELETRGYKELFQDIYIPKEKLFSKEVDIEHIIPKALLFDDSYSNKTLTFRDINLKKSDRTAYDFIDKDYHSDLDSYVQRVENLFKSKIISQAKRNKLLMPRTELPDDFIERDLRNSQYIARQAYKMLQTVFKTVTPTSGSITDKLREDWDLINVMKELNLPKYKALGLTEMQERKNGKYVEVIKDWTKRNDHRHHAMDALTVAFTSPSHIQYLNNLNTFYDVRGDETDHTKSSLYEIKNRITKRVPSSNGRKKRKFIAPMAHFREAAKQHLEEVLISIKAKNKVVTRNVNKTQKKLGEYHRKIQLTPRDQLHKETVYGKIKMPKAKPSKLNKRFSIEEAQMIINPAMKSLVCDRLARYDNDPLMAFDSKNLKKDPLVFGDTPLKEVQCFEEIFTIRKPIGPDLKIEKVIDLKIQSILRDRLESHNGDAKKAFSDIENDPIWLNEEKGIPIKSVTIKGVNNAESLHHARDHKGTILTDTAGRLIPIDYVSTGNNHHVAIYRDANGILQENVVSFYEAVSRAIHNISIIDKTWNSHLGWKFLFTMKQNEMFVFPSEDFDPYEIDLMDPHNAKIISPHLFRIQKIANKNYMFRHHLESTVNNDLEFTYKLIQTPKKLERLEKVRLNHLGQIVQVGEY